MRSIKSDSDLEDDEPRLRLSGEVSLRFEGLVARDKVSYLYA
jgi:hypothetical protein